MADTEYEEWLEYPHARLRFELDTDQGKVRQFVVQLEYCLDDEWEPVVRFDHDPQAEQGHDIREEGVHLDVYRDGEKYRVERGFPPVPLSHAPRYRKSYVEDHAGRLLERFEEWHDLNRR